MKEFARRSDNRVNRKSDASKKRRVPVLAPVSAILLTLLVVLSCAPREARPPSTDISAPVLSEEQLFLQAEAFERSGETDKALTAYSELFTRFPDGVNAPTAVMKAAAIHAAGKSYPDARSLYRWLLDRYPESYYSTDARMGILEAYFNEGRYEDVVAFRSGFDDSGFSESQKAALYSITGEAFVALGRQAEAAEQFVRAYSAAPDTLEAEQSLDRLRATLEMLSPIELRSLLEEITDPRLQALIRETAEPLIFERLHVGCILPLTGRFESFGKRALQGIELAVAQFGARTNADSLKVIIKDSASDPEKAAAAVRELVSENHVAAIIGAITTAETAALEAQKAGVPIITLSQKEGVPDIGGYVFRNFITHTLQVRTLVAYAFNYLGVRRFAILYPDENYGRIFMNAFWDEVLARQGVVVAAEAYNPEDTDFADAIKKLVGLYYPEPQDLKRAREAAAHRLNMEDPSLFAPESALAERLNSVNGLLYMIKDALSGSVAHAATAEDEKEEEQPIVDFGALFIPDAPQKAGLILPQLAYYDIKDTYLLGTNLWHSDKFIDMTDKYNRGVIFPDGFFAESDDETVKAFVATFTSTFDSPPGFIEAVAFDTAMLLFQTARGPEIISRDALRDALIAMPPYPGATGLTSFTENGDCMKTLRLLRIRRGKFAEITAGP